MTGAGSGATRWGVRVLEPDEMRRVARLAGLVTLVYGLSNPLVRHVAADLIIRPGLPSWLGVDLHDWIGIVTCGLGLFVFVAGVRASDRGISRHFAPFAIFGFVYGALGLPLVMWIDRYPTTGIIAIGYSIIAILAFYLLARWAALTVVALMLAGQWWLEAASDTPWPVWLTPAFIGVTVVVAGYFIGHLMQQLNDLNANLEAKVAEQVGEVERFGRLRRFLSAPVAEAILESSDESRLAPHRREIAVLFCDLRGFTAFTKQVEPEEVMYVLDAYYAAAGEQITRFHATLGSFEGDGLMAYLNDPVPCDEPAKRVVEMALAIADAIDELTPAWQRRGYDLSYGIGMALGHATLGIVGYDGRSDYTALGTVVNLGARLCGTAAARELVVDHRVFLHAEDDFRFVEREPVTLKGFGEPVATYLVDRS
ncbi:MAG: adenylate/guanylate cyclase domain-containing protein [Aeromicrobium sp.]